MLIYNEAQNGFFSMLRRPKREREERREREGGEEGEKEGERERREGRRKRDEGRGRREGGRRERREKERNGMISSHSTLTKITLEFSELMSQYYVYSKYKVK